MKKIKFLSYIYLMFVMSGAGFCQSLNIDSGYVRVIGTAGDSTIVNYLSAVENMKRMEFDHFFSQQLLDSVFIILAESETEFYRIAGSSIPEWSAAVAFPAHRTIVMKPGQYFDPHSYRVSLLHELAHLYMADKLAGHRIPLWLNEGVAMYVAGRELTWQDNVTLGNAVLAENLLAFPEIDKLLRFQGAKAQIAYLQSFMTIKFFVINYGETQLRNMLDSLALGTEIEDYFKSEFNFSYADFEYQSLRQIKEKFWWMIFLQVEYLIWIIILILVFCAILVVKIRNHRKISRWTDDENNYYKEF